MKNNNHSFENDLINKIKIIKTPKKKFNERLLFYNQCFKDYKKWRLNFKFPKTTFLSRVQNVKPIPDINLINNLAKSISELREEFLSLRNYKASIIFKLFLFYFAEMYKVKNKLKINKSIGGRFGGWASGGKTPTRRDISSIMEIVIDKHFKFEDFLSDSYQKFRKGATKDWEWDWKKKKNFKWNPVWKQFHLKKSTRKPYEYFSSSDGTQSHMALRDHSTKDEFSIQKINKMEKKYEILKKKKATKYSFEIINLFYDLNYCKDFNEIEKIFAETEKNKLINKYNDWLPLKSEIGTDGKAIPHFEDGGGAYKNRVFPQFTLKNIKARFNTNVFLDELVRYNSMKENYYHKDLISAMIKALNADEELKFAFEYDEILPEMDLILPAYTSGSLYNYLDNDLTFTTIFRASSVILELSESFETCYGFLSSKKRKKNFLLKYSSNRDGTTNCYMIKEFSYTGFIKEASKFINKELLEDIKGIPPDNLVLNKDFKFDLKKIIKILKPLTKKKRDGVMFLINEDDENFYEKKQEQENTGTYIYLLSTQQINKQISEFKMDGSIKFSFPKKRGKIDFSADAKLYSGSKLEIKADYFI